MDMDTQTRAEAAGYARGYHDGYKDGYVDGYIARTKEEIKALKGGDDEPEQRVLENGKET